MKSEVKKQEQLTDDEVIDRILNGDTALFEILIRRNNSFLYKTGRSYNYSHATTEDLMQDTFIEAYLNLAKFQRRSSFRTWIIRIMLNKCYRQLQKMSFKNEAASDIKDKSVPMFTNQKKNDTTEAVLTRELGMVIENALSKIPIDYRMVFSLREISGLNVRETAEALEISESNVKVRLNRAKAYLRKEIEKTYSVNEIYEYNLVYCDSMVAKVMAKINDE